MPPGPADGDRKIAGPASYGVYALIGTIGIFGTVTLGLNLYIYVYRAVSRGVGRRADEGVFKSTSSFEIAGASIVVFAVLASGGLPRLAGLLNASGYELFFALGLLQIILLVAIAEITNFFSAQARLEEANWVDFLAQGAWVLAPALLWVTGFRVGLGTFLVAQIVGLTAAVTYAACRIGVRRWWSQRVDGSVIRSALVFSLPLMVPALSVYSLKLADRPILSHYISLTDVGVYSFAFSFLNTLYSFTAGVVFATTGPRLWSRTMLAMSPRDALLSYMLKMAVLAFLGPVLCLVALARPLLVFVARPEYAASAGVMPLVGAAYLLIILAYPAHTLMTMQNRVKTLAIIDVAGMAAGLAGNFLLIPRYSYWGAATASAIGFGLAMVLKWALSGILSSFRFDVLFSFRDEIAAVKWYVRRVVNIRRKPSPAETDYVVSGHHPET